MYAVEFQTKVINGRIQIPEKYINKIRPYVRVILIVEDTAETPPDVINELLEYPIKLSDFKPFQREEIYERI